MLISLSDPWIIAVLAACAGGTAYGLAQSSLVHRKTEESLRSREASVRKREVASIEKEQLLASRDAAFQEGYVSGRAWLASFISEAIEKADLRESELLRKSRPARKSAEVVAEIKREKTDLVRQLKLCEYQIRTYEEYFPFLADYRDAILNDEISPAQTREAAIANSGDIDPARKFLTADEYKALSSSQRSQLALDRYISRSKSNWEIGRAYERYIGWLYEKERWKVNYHGAIKGFEDLGRDLICDREEETHVVQAKCWSASKLIHEKHIFQLFGTYLLLRQSNPKACPVFITTTSLSETAELAAKLLNVSVKQIPLDLTYPMVKCNISKSNGDKIYHLPFDQQYDRIVIEWDLGEMYVQTCNIAEQLGFRRAFRYIPSAT